MKIGIIGSGNVGGALGTRWAANGHSVVFGSRHPDSAQMLELVAKAPGSRAVANAEAVKHADVILLATPWDATKEIIDSLGDLSGKVVLDTTNPIAPDLSGLSIGTTTSAGEQVAQWLPGANVVKAFNTVGNNVMADPTFGDAKVVMFYCGDDAGAKKTAAALITELGFDAVDAGAMVKARLLEPFAMLWISLAFGGYTREIAFEFLRR